MATYSERAALAVDPVFQGRTKNAATKYAMYQMPSDDESDAWYLARSVLNNPDHWARQFALAVSSEPETLGGEQNDPAVDSDEGDAALQYAVEMRVWPAYSVGMAPPVSTPPADAP